MSTLQDLLKTQFFHNTLLDWGLAALAFTFTFLVLPLLRGRIRARQERWTERHSPALSLFTLLIARTSRLLLLIAALYFAEKILTLPVQVDRLFDTIIIVGVWIQVGIWATVTVRFFVTRQHRGGIDNDPEAKSSIDILMFCATIIIWLVFTLLALDNLGVNITALVAGLGVGGIAVALAVQTILSDILGSLSIAFDKPFAVGDTLRIDDYEGVVEHIGIKSTRLRSVTGEQIIMANADVLKSRVRNMGRMAERRVLFKLLVAYDTPQDKLDRLVEVVRGAVQSQKHARFVQCLLNSLGEYAMEFQVIYFIANTSDANVGGIMDAVNRGILKDFSEAGIRLAYPSRRVFVEEGFRKKAPVQAPPESA